MYINSGSEQVNVNIESNSFVNIYAPQASILQA